MKRIQPYSMIACCYLFCNSSLLSIRDVHNYASLQHLSKARFDCPSPHNRSSVTTYFTLRMTARKEEKKKTKRRIHHTAHGWDNLRLAARPGGKKRNFRQFCGWPVQNAFCRALLPAATRQRTFHVHFVGRTWRQICTVYIALTCF